MMNETTTLPLPVFLERDAEYRLRMVVHCTQLQEYDLCVEKFWLHYGASPVEAAAARPALNYGGAVHEALRLRYSDDRNTPLDTLGDIQAARLNQWFDIQPQPPDEWRNAGRAIDLIRAYNEQWPTHDWQVLAVEEEFEAGVGEIASGDFADTTGDPIMLPVLLRGRKDLVVAWHDGLWVVDHKTAQDWGKGDSNSHLDEGRMSFQFRGYAWAERQRQVLLGENTDIISVSVLGVRDSLPVLGTVGNYLVSRKPYATDAGAKKSTTPRNQFHMEAYPYSSAELDEWREECLAKCREVLAHWQANDWPLHRKRGSCGHWGRCEFFEYCAASPTEREAILATSEFKVKEQEREL